MQKSFKLKKKTMFYFFLFLTDEECSYITIKTFKLDVLQSSQYCDYHTSSFFLNTFKESH